MLWNSLWAEQIHQGVVCFISGMSKYMYLNNGEALSKIQNINRKSTKNLNCNKYISILTFAAVSVDFKVIPVAREDTLVGEVYVECRLF